MDKPPLTRDEMSTSHHSLPAALQEETLSCLLQEPCPGDLMLVCKRWKDVMLTDHWIVQQPIEPPELECWPALYEDEEHWQETPEKEVLLGRALADRRKSVCQIFTQQPKEAFELGFRHQTFDVGCGPELPPCEGPLYVMVYEGGSRFRENLDPYFSPDPIHFVAARPAEDREKEVERIKEEMEATQALLSELMGNIVI